MRIDLLRIVKYLLYLYFCFAPLLWLPYFEVDKMRIMKIILFVLIIFIFTISISLSKRLFLPKRVLIYCGICLILFIPYFIISDNFFGALNYFFNYFSAALVVIIAINLKLDESDAFKFFFLLVIVNLYCLFPTLNFFFDLPDWQKWAPISEARGNYLPRPFWMTGFNGGRTGWSESVALFVPFVYYFVKKKHFLLNIFLGICLIVITQLISGGRNGFFATIIALLIIAFKEKGIWKMITFFSITFLAFILFFSQYFDSILVFFRIYDEASEAFSDNITSDRSKMYEAFPSIFMEAPIFGKGFLGSQKSLYPKYIDQDNLEMHSGILRVFIDHGLFFGLMMVFLLWYSMKKALHLVFDSKKNIYTTVFPAIIIQGIFISFFQPLSLFGGFQISLIWWFSLGILIKYDSKREF